MEMYILNVGNSQVDSPSDPLLRTCLLRTTFGLTHWPVYRNAAGPGNQPGPAAFLTPKSAPRLFLVKR